MTEASVQYQRQGRVAWLTLHRPPLHVLNIPMMRELLGAIERAEQECDIAVLRGSGDRAFSAGADVADHLPDRVGEMLQAFHAIFRRLWTGELVTVAAVQGHCLGGGCELATFCDFVLADPSAVFGFPEIKLGCFPPVALVTLPRLVGARRAMELVLTGRTVSAAEAEEYGLVNRVVPAGQLDAAVQELLATLEQLSPSALRLTRSEASLHAFPDLDEELDEVEDFYLSELMRTADAVEGIRAFLEKRAPVWAPRRSSAGGQDG